MCQLLFSLPVTTAHVEQIFSRLKVVKTDRRTNLQIATLNDLLEISVKGPSLPDFNADAAVELWWHDCNTTCRVDQDVSNSK